jgi:hypothetical protein
VGTNALKGAPRPHGEASDDEARGVLCGMGVRNSKAAGRVSDPDQRTWVLGAEEGDRPLSRRQRRLMAHVARRGSAGRLVPTLIGGGKPRA